MVDIQQALAAGELFRAHAFDYACAQLDIKHRPIRPRHPCTNGQVERINLTIKDTTVERFHYKYHDESCLHLVSFVDAYNYARRL